jgi:FkbM family methyltransferase
MLSAAHGHHVDVFEPNPVNILRQCESSLLLNQWENAEQSDVLNRTKKKGSINIYPYGVGANVTAKTLFIGRNPGQASFEGRRIPKWRDPVKKNIAVITLDNMADELEWVHRKMPIAILKVDVEGFEPFVFAGATNLLKSGLVQNIFMELTANDAELSLNLDMIQTLLDAGYQVCRYGGMGGPTTTFNYTEIPLDASFAQKLIQKFVPDGKAQVNLWWALQKTTQLCS